MDSDPRHERARVLRAGGATWAAIGRELGVVGATAHRWVMGEADGKREQTRVGVAKVYAARRAEGFCRCGAVPRDGLATCEACCRAGAERKARVRAAVLAAYGGRCACCGEDETRFLTIDHVNNDGATHRREIGSGALYWWLAKNGYPAGYRLLCWNCNCGRALNGGICPHEEHSAVVEPLRAVT